MPEKRGSQHKRRRTYLREWRLYREMTPQQVAALIGRDDSTLTRLETGKSAYTQRTLEQLAEVYHCDVTDLLSHDPTRPNVAAEASSLRDAPVSPDPSTTHGGRSLSPADLKSRQEEIRAVNRLVFENVEGWVGDQVWHILDFIQRHHWEGNVRGDIAEIGVHHGKLFFLIASLARDNEVCVAMDLFEDQQLNVDGSGRGGRATFEQHIANLFPHLKNRIRIVPIDSLSITAVTARRIVSERGVRIFSVDGGHTTAHVVNDLSIAQELLVSSGVILLDDFFGPVWPTVTEGFFQYMSSANRRLAPLLIYQNKLFLTTVSEQERMMAALWQFIKEERGNEIHTRWRHATLLGSKVLCFG